ncbi:MAG: HEPN domain-containing protein [Bacteroidetes bacterium]|nr:HEPN domain-containing protein [Bacteroidota bacterium]MBL7103062.1 HEPN domain-containing protein [Bacteroidales bacterium]
MKYPKDDLIIYRIKRAKETFEAAKIMADNDQWNSCINRLYYACFYAVIAVLLKENLSPKTHSGARSLFGLHYIKTGVVSKTEGEIYNELFDLRQTGDYEDFFNFDKEIIEPLIEPAGKFIEVIESLLN